MKPPAILRISHEGKERVLFAGDFGEVMRTDLGVIDLRELNDKTAGDTITSHTGHTFRVSRPRAPDFFRYMKRTGAPMQPKDIGTIIAYIGLSHNDTVLDAGTGSGILAMYLGCIAKRVVTCEIREDFAEIARKNMELAGLGNVEVRCADVLDVLASGERFDAVALDMGGADKAAALAAGALLPGGYLAVYSPFIEHAKEVRTAVAAANVFTEIYTLESIEREITFGERGTRPSTSRVGHTGYITIARLR